MKLYKLVDENYTTQNNTKWEIGKSKRLWKCKNPQLCSGDVFHAYRDINLGLLFNPKHADINNPRILECDGDICVEDYDKVGVFKLKVINEVEIPNWYKDEKKRRDVFVQFAILCAESVLLICEKKHPGNDIPRKALEEAKKYFTGNFDSKKCKALSHECYDHFSCISSIAGYAANAAADAADAAYSAAYSAAAADNAYTVVAVYAADAANVAVSAGINLIKLMKQAIKMRG